MTPKNLTLADVIERHHLSCYNNIVPSCMSGEQSPCVHGITIDSRIEQKNHIFAALPGRTHHGAQFAHEALAHGAIAILTDNYGACQIEELPVPIIVSDNIIEQLGVIAAQVYDNPAHKLELVGITGTSGKTTTSYLTAAAMPEPTHTGLLGTIEVRLGDTHLPSALTTPQAPQLQKILDAMVDQQAVAAVMEVSSHAVSQYRVAGCHFSVAAFTNLSHDHLDYHANMEEYFAAKSQLFTDPRYGRPIPIISIDDEWGIRLAQQLSSDERLITVSTHAHRKAHWMAGRSHVVRGGQKFRFTDPAGGWHEAHIALPGRYNVANALMALAIGVTCGSSLEQSMKNISSVHVPGRLEVIDRGQSFIALVDYAHKPAAIGAVLKTMREVTRNTGGRLAIVFGAGGDRDKKKRSMMGQIAAQMADLVVITDDNPRTEDPAAIRQEIYRGAQSVSSSAHIIVISPREAAIEYACTWARGADVVIVAGKGHEQGQEVQGIKIPFDDRAHVAAAIDQKTTVMST